MGSEIEIANQQLSSRFETLLNSLAQVFFWPIVVCVLLMFVYALFSFGGLVVDAVRRRTSSGAARLMEIKPNSTVETIELEIIRQLEALRLCSRIAPMLGLVATMIPLGPTLASLSTGNANLQTETLGHSFAVVIIALLAASITFAIYTVRRRWLLTELNQWIESNEAKQETSE
jgi:biopolymer transport protein ExbB/TolQ